jgi:ubiquinone/menaquinone biosynthesis C-methylase UbiE
MNKNQINYNKKIHDELFKTYNLKHSEIYNEIEQNRLKKIIKKLIRLSNKRQPNILDVGAGTGNLSLKFLETKCKVIASDVSLKSLELLKKLSNNNKNLSLSLIKNENLHFENNVFDIVCTYSVLHHIPDYLHTIKEMIRVCKPDGLIYIDHEANKNRWNPDKNLSEYNSITKQTNVEHFKKLLKTREIFSEDFWKSLLIRLFINKKHKREGDIHVWKEDHINWDKIKDLLKKENCKIVEDKDYLMYRPKGGIKIYNKYKSKCNDTKYLIIKNVRSNKKKLENIKKLRLNNYIDKLNVMYNEGL